MGRQQVAGALLATSACAAAAGVLLDVAVEARLYAALGEATEWFNARAAWKHRLDAFVADGTIDAATAERWADRIEADDSPLDEEVRESARAYARRLIEQARDLYEGEPLSVADQLAALREGRRHRRG